MKLKVLIYGDIDLNFLDGSAIWLTSIVHTLSQNKFYDIKLLLKAPVKETWKYNGVDELKNVEIIDPYEFYENEIKSKYRLSVKEAASILERLESTYKLDCIITRGYDLAVELLNYDITSKTLPYITDLEKINSGNGKSQFINMINNFPYLFIQTLEGIEYLSSRLNVSKDKFKLMTPMIPKVNNSLSTNDQSLKSMVYTGKLAKEWYIDELLSISSKLNEIDTEFVINIAGDKFQGELSERKEEITNLLQNQSNINWVGSVSREESMDLIQNSGFGFAWRDSKIDNDNSLELSTKLLEYGQLKKPVFLRRTKIYENLLGEDYFLFIESEEDLINKINILVKNPELYLKAAETVYQATLFYNYEAANKRLVEALSPFFKDKVNLLIAGHDLKFFTSIQKQLELSNKFNIKVDKWASHSGHDVEKSQEYVEWADVIFCEWGLGNAVWYSNNKKRNQSLYIRLHAQERFTNYPEQFNYNNIDGIIVVTPYMMEEFAFKKGVPRSKMHIIYNAVDFEKYSTVKTLSESELKYNLGICGILPKLKRPDLAIEVFKKLWEKDKRYKLFIKSKLPKDLPWLKNRPEEMEYYDELFSEIKGKAYENNIIFDAHGNDVEKWLTKIGFILSTSDHESFHLAPVEGIVSGSIPVIRNWDGAETIYPKSFIHDSVDEMASFIYNSDNFSEVEKKLNNSIKQYDVKYVAKEIEELIIKN